MENSNSILTTQTEVRTLFTKFYIPRRLRGRPEGTKKQYHYTIDRLAEFLSHEPIIADLSEDTLAQFLTWRREKVAAPTCNKDRSQLLALANFAARRGLISSPEVDPEKEPERIPLAWLQTDLAALFKACAGERGHIDGVPSSLWWRGLHMVAWDTGERIGAILSIAWEMLDLQTGWLLIHAEDRKGSTRDKRYRLHDETIGIMRALALPKREKVFPWPYCRTYIWLRYEKLLERAGLPTDRKSKFHRLRKSVASHAEAAGLDATKILDHSDRKVTRAYLDPRIVRPQQPSDVLFRPGDGDTKM